MHANAPRNILLRHPFSLTEAQVHPRIQRPCIIALPAESAGDTPGKAFYKIERTVRMPEPQSYKNHTRWDPAWHFFIAPFMLLSERALLHRPHLHPSLGFRSTVC